MWTYLTTFVFLRILDSARVPAPCGQLDHQTNNPGVQHLLRAWHITMFTECRRKKEQFTPLQEGSPEAGVRPQTQSSHLLLVSKNGVGPMEGRMATRRTAVGTAQEQEQAAWLELRAQLCQTAHIWDNIPRKCRRMPHGYPSD